MEFNFFELNGSIVAEIIADDMIIKTAQDALDIMMNAQYQGATRLIIHERQLSPQFLS
ncbi:MAG: DUF4180 domain-containing protein [Deinococcales bacterium]